MFAGGFGEVCGVFSWAVCAGEGVVLGLDTGGGGGGAMVALCPENAEEVAEAMRRAGYKAMVTQIGTEGENSP